MISEENGKAGACLLASPLRGRDKAEPLLRKDKEKIIWWVGSGRGAQSGFVWAQRKE